MGNRGRIVEYLDKDNITRKGIIYDKDQTKETEAKGKYIMSKIGSDYEPLDEPKIIKDYKKLKIIGYVD